MNRHVSLIVLAAVLTASGCQQPVAEPISQEAVAASAGCKPEILVDDFRSHVAYLADDACEGRLTGSPGARRAAEYIAGAFQSAGLKQVLGKNGYYQPFEFTAGVRMVAGENQLEIPAPSPAAKPAPCKLDEDFRPLAFSASGAAEGEVVFAGYGIVEPESKGGGYDSYAGLDVTDKIVLVLRHLPEDITPERRQALSLYASDRYKAKLAARRGAKGFLLVTGPNTPNAGKLVKLRGSDRVAEVQIPAASVSGDLAERLLKLGGLDDLATLQSAHDTEPFNPHIRRDLTGVRVRLATGLERVRNACRNVIGVLPATRGEDEYIIVGAHYDHLGLGIGLGSLARQDEMGRIHNGADDNASGTAMVLELAAAYAEMRRSGAASSPQRGLIFACWSGEELGIIGSTHYTNDPPIPLDKVVATFNFDMVGRLTDNKLIVQALGSSPAWPDLVERHNEAAGFDLKTQNDPYLPTDAMEFYTSGVPILAIFTGSHEDYHRPGDDAHLLNYEGLARIAAYARDLIDATARPAVEIAYARAEPKAAARGGGGMRAYTGTVPDYAGGDVAGVLLSDVRPGGPAEKAGVKAGDTIVEFAGQQITNLQDYSDALIAVKIGQPIKVVVLRDGRRVTLTITPTARPE